MHPPRSTEFHYTPASPDDEPIDVIEIEPGVFATEDELAASQGEQQSSQPDTASQPDDPTEAQASRPAGERTDWRQYQRKKRPDAGKAEAGPDQANTVPTPTPDQVFGTKPKTGTQEPRKDDVTATAHANTKRTSSVGDGSKTSADSGSAKNANGEPESKAKDKRNDYRKGQDEKAARRAEKAARGGKRKNAGQQEPDQTGNQSNSPDTDAKAERAARRQAAKERAARRAAEQAAKEAAAQAAAERANQPGKELAVLGAAALGPVVLGDDIPRVRPGAEWRYRNENGSHGRHENGERQPYPRNAYLEQQIRFMFVPGSERWKAFFGDTLAPGYVDVDDLTPPPTAPRHQQVGQRSTPVLEAAAARTSAEPETPGSAQRAGGAEAYAGQPEQRGRSRQPQEVIKRLGGKIIGFAAEKAAARETEATGSQPESVRRRIASLLGKLASRNSALEAQSAEPAREPEAPSPVKDSIHEQDLKDALRERDEAQAAYDAIADDDNVSPEAKMAAGTRLMEAREYYWNLMPNDAEAFQQFMRERQRRDEDDQS